MNRIKSWRRKLGYMRERWPRPLGTRPPTELAVCAIFRDEARYLAEWVSFHRLQGVERFYLYENRSSDDWQAQLEPEMEADIVEVQHWPFVPGQLSAYQDCLERHRHDARWIAFIDIDEFLFSPTGRPLPEILRRFGTHPAVLVNWRLYGTSGFEQPPDGLVIENFLWRAPDDFPGNRWMKSIVNPRGALGPASAHHFRLIGDPVGEDRQPVEKLVVREPTADLLRINHYYSKSEEDFQRKAARPVARTGEVKIGRDPPPADAVKDETILQFGPQLRDLLASRPAPHGLRASSDAA
jgi:Glycosyltransferase family 92